MSQVYSDPSRESEPTALPDIETWYTCQSGEQCPNYPTVFDEAWPTIRVRYHAGDDYTEVSVWHATIPDTRGALLLTRDIPALIARAARRPVPELWKVERYL